MALYVLAEEWDTGYCGEYTLRNTSEFKIVDWMVSLGLGEGIVVAWWGSDPIHPEPGVYEFHATRNNREIAPGSFVTFGLCGERPAGNRDMVFVRDITTKRAP